MEVMMVVAIVGMIAMVATPNIQSMSRGYLSREGAQFMHNIVDYGRDRAFKINAPMVTTFTATEAISCEGEVDASVSGDFLLYYKKWDQNCRSFPYPEHVIMGTTGDIKVGSQLAFCPTTDYRHLDQTGNIAPAPDGPVCEEGNLSRVVGAPFASYSEANLHFTSRHARYNVHIRLPLAATRLLNGY